MEQVILQSSLTDDEKLTKGSQCVHKNVDGQSFSPTDNEEETRNSKTVNNNTCSKTINIEDKFDLDSKEAIEQFHSNITAIEISPYLKKKQFLSALISSEPSKSNSVYQENHKLIKQFPPIQTKSRAGFFSDESKDELHHKQETQFDTTVSVKLANHNVNTKCDNVSTFIASNQNYIQPGQKCCVHDEAETTTEDMCKHCDDFVQPSKMNNCATCWRNKPVNDYLSIPENTDESNSVHISKLINCTTIYMKDSAENDQSFLKLPKKSIEKDITNEVQIKDQCLFEGKTNNTEGLSNQEQYLQMLKNSICENPETNSISYTASPIEKQYKQNKEFDTNCSTTAAKTSLDMNIKLAGAIKNIHSNKRKGCHSWPQNTCNRDASHPSLNKEEHKATSVISLKTPFTSNTKGHAIILPSTTNILDIAAKNSGLASAIKNIRRKSKKECNISQNDSKNNLISNKRITNELSNKCSISNSQLLSNKSEAEILDKCEILDHTFNGISKPSQVITKNCQDNINKIPEVSIITNRNNNVTAEFSTSFSSEAVLSSLVVNKSISGTQELSNELEHERKEKQSGHDNETQNITNCKQTYVTKVLSTKKMTILDAPLQDVKLNENKENMITKSSLGAALILSKEQLDESNSVSLSALNNSALTVHKNVENELSENSSVKEVYKVISYSLTEHKIKKAETLQSVLDQDNINNISEVPVISINDVPKECNMAFSSKDNSNSPAESKSIPGTQESPNELEEHERMKEQSLHIKETEKNGTGFIQIDATLSTKQTTIFDPPLQDNTKLKESTENMAINGNLDAALHLSKEQLDVPNSVRLSISNNSALTVCKNIENELFVNGPDEEKHKGISLDSLSEQKIKKAVTARSVFDINVSSYLFPKYEDFFNSKMDVWDGFVWGKKYAQHAFYHGNQILSPLETCASSPFSVSLLKRLQELSFPGPTCIQKLVWPAIFRGCNVVTIAPARSGKTLSYLLPIASQLIEQGQYNEFIGHEGPLAVVLCSNWKKAQTVYNQCKLLLQNCNININVVYSGGSETSQKIPLLNGCKILIITPPCYLRLHEEDKRIVNMAHCCHLVFDDADRIIDKFLMEVSEIMKQFVDAVYCHRESLLPNQIVLCSEHWNKQMSYFVYNCIPDPLIIMTAFDEAAIYAQVPTFCHIHSVSAASMLLKLIGSLEKKKVVICTHYVETARQIYELLFCTVSKVLLVHGNLIEQEINKASSDWKKCSKMGVDIILVSTDDVILQLDIKDANCLVHYDTPELPNFHFGLRYSFIASNFCTLEKNFSGSVSDCVCHIFIPKTLSNYLLKFLRQLPCEIPDDLILLTEKLREEKEYKNVHLCHYFKAYGACPSQRICSYRHRIDQKLDNVTYVPRYGPVKIFVTNVIDATHYYARIVEHNDPCCMLNCTSYLTLSLKLSNYYSTTINRIRPAEIKVHVLYGLQTTENTFHRVWVTRINSYDATGSSQSVFIHYVDEGWCEEIIEGKFLILPTDLAKFPAQAVEIYACNVRPIDKCYEWTPQASIFIHNMINGKEVEGKVVLGLHNILWLDPIVYHLQIEISNVTVVQAVINDIIIKKEFGIKNSDHLTKLYSACDGIIKLPNTNINLEAQEHQLAFLDHNKFHDVYVYSVRSPDFFFVQRTDFIECIDSISDKLDKMIKKGMLKKPKRIVKDMICAAPFAGENSWFRATVNYVDINNGQVDLFFVDYGDTNVAKIENIYLIPSELLLLPFQAIECSLAGLMPYGCNWTCEAGKLLYDLCSSETATTKMIVKALKSEPSHFRKGKRYIIQLWDTSSEYDIYVANELVKQGVALPCSLPDIPENENGQQSETDELSLEEEICEKAFFTAVLYGQIDELIANINNEKKAQSSSLQTCLPSDSITPVATITNDSVKHLAPKVQWYQTDKTISIQISVANMTNYEMNIVGLHFCFMAPVAGDVYQFEMELFELVQSETCDVKTTDTSIVFTFLKEAGKWWPQLSKTTNKNVNLLEINDKKNADEDTDSEISVQVPIIKWDSQDILPYEPNDEYEKENQSDDDVPWEQVCLPLDLYDMLCWD